MRTIKDAELIRLTKIEQALAHATDLSDIKKIIDIAEAARIYARRARIKENNARLAEEIKLKGQRKAGEYLKQLRKGRGGDHKSKDQKRKLNVFDSDYRKVINDVGIDIQSAQRWQRVFGVPSDQFVAYLKKTLETGREATTAGLLKEAKQNIRQKRKAETEENQRKALKVLKAAAIDEVADLRVGCMEEILPTLRNLDAIIADPPYGRDALPLYASLAQYAPAALKPKGILAVMCGQSYLPEIFKCMTEGQLPYRWTMAYLTPGGQSVQLWNRSVNTFWKPILLFGEDAKWIGDVVTSNVNDNDKRFHEWGQSESGMIHLVERLTEPGSRICDPFLGAGTTAVAAVMLGRQIIGCDIDESSVAKARARIAEILHGRQ